MHMEGTTRSFRNHIGTRGVLNYFVHLKLVQPRERFLRQRAGLRVSFYKLVRAHPVDKILPAVPKSEHYIRIAFVDRTQDVVGNKSGHLIYQTGAFPEPLFEGVPVFLVDVNTISNTD